MQLRPGMLAALLLSGAARLYPRNDVKFCNIVMPTVQSTPKQPKNKQKTLACRARRCSCGRTCQRRCMCVKQYQILQHVHVICELCWYNMNSCRWRAGRGGAAAAGRAGDAAAHRRAARAAAPRELPAAHGGDVLRQVRNFLASTFFFVILCSGVCCCCAREDVFLALQAASN